MTPDFFDKYKVLWNAKSAHNNIVGLKNGDRDKPIWKSEYESKSGVEIWYLAYNDNGPHFIWKGTRKTHHGRKMSRDGIAMIKKVFCFKHKEYGERLGYKIF